MVMDTVIIAITRGVKNLTIGAMSLHMTMVVIPLTIIIFFIIMEI